MAGEEGLEPPLPGPKPGVLPLDDSPLNRLILAVLVFLVQRLTSTEGYFPAKIN